MVTVSVTASLERVFTVETPEIINFLFSKHINHHFKMLRHALIIQSVVFY